MSDKREFTLVMLDDDEDEAFITKRLVLRGGILNQFVSERKPESIFQTLKALKCSGENDDEKIILLLDINMPRQDGFETLRKIRLSSEFGHMPVIMLSASENDADMIAASILGADGYLVKPFRSDAFFEALKDVDQVKYQLVGAD